MSPRTWCQVTYGAVFCGVAIPAGIGLLLLVAMIPGCGNPWGTGVTAGVLLAAGWWGLTWILGEVGTQWDRLDSRRTTPNNPLTGRNTPDIEGEGP